MLQYIKRRKQGFTLIELAIVLTIAGLLFVGLWRLLAGGNTQIRDQSVANEQQQIITAVKAYLASGADAFLQNTVPTAPGNIQIKLPTTNTSLATCQATTAPNAGICSYLPSGFTSSTPNAYGQTYTIRVLRNDTTAIGTAPNTYSFMIVTAGGDAIPDTSGGRISAGIGNDGGFVYTNGTVCTAQTGATTAFSACGAYGTWASGIATYGFTTASNGHVASRTYASPSADNLFPWLERNTSIQPDAAFTWNTMTTDLYMGGTSSAGGTDGNIYMLPPAASAAFGAGVSGNIFMGGPGATTLGGTINLVGGQIIEGGDAGNTGAIKMTASGALTVGVGFIDLITNCTADQQPAFLPQVAGCKPGLQVNGDINILGMMQAYDFYAQTFIYQGSDIRFKSNIHPLANPLADVMRLKPVAFTLKSNGREGLGVIAQDIEKVYPQLVSENNGAKGVAYDGLIAPLIGAVQELKKENDQLRDQLRDQAARQQHLEDELRKNENP